jgi:hypothetical protein
MSTVLERARYVADVHGVMHHDLLELLERQVTALEVTWSGTTSDVNPDVLAATFLGAKVAG